MRLGFVVHGSNHAQITYRSIAQLRSMGHEALVFDLELLGIYLGAPRQLRALGGIDSLPITALERFLGPGDIVVVCCDWSGFRTPFSNLLNRLRAIGCIIVAITEACRWGRNERYRVADFILAYAPAAQAIMAQRALPRPVAVVGSPVIEDSMQSARLAGRSGGFVLCNYKIPKSSIPFTARETWLHEVIDACACLGLPLVLTKHPNTGVPEGVACSGESLADLLPRASALVSPTSTVIVEALASNIPVILHRNGNDTLCEFSDPAGAFDITEDTDQLRRALAKIQAGDHPRLLRSSAFLRDNLDHDDAHPAWQRITDAILKIADTTQRQPWPQSRPDLDFIPPWKFRRRTGSAIDDYVLCRPEQHSPDHCMYGFDYAVLAAGHYRGLFDVDLAAAVDAREKLLTIDVFETTRTRRVIASRGIGAADVAARGKQALFVDAECVEGDTIEFRLYWHGRTEARINGLYVLQSAH